MTAAILNLRSAAAPDTAQLKDTRTLVRLFELDRLPMARPMLACRWRLARDGRLACRWEVDAAWFHETSGQ
jgi:hypothetical protein